MTGGRKTKNSESSSAEISKKSANVNSSRNAEGSTSNIFVEVTPPPLENARTHVVEEDANPQQELEHVDLPSSPQASSPQDLGNTNFPALVPESSSSPDSSQDGDDTASYRSSEEAEALKSGAPAAPVDVDAIIASTIARASDAMQELATLASSREPLWLPDETNNTEIINDVEYMRQFVDINDMLMRTVEAVEEREKKAIGNSGNTNESESSEEFGQNPAMISSESSRAVEYFRVRPIVIMEHLMDVEHWRATFSNIVAIGSLKVVLESPEEEGNYAGTLQVIHAEFNSITPFIPARESCFARYCKQLGSGLWGVVDVSVDELFRYPPRIYRRLPSGCLIQEMPNGFTKVTWVENAEVDNRLVHSSYQQIVSSGFAFGAKRWVNGIIRHFQWHAALRNPIYHGDVNLTTEHTVAYVMLSERMVRAFFADISAATSSQLPWTKPVRISRKSNVDDPGRPIGTRMVYMTSVHLPGVPQQKLFNFLHEPQFRPVWDMYAQLHSFDEFAHIPIGEDPRNRVSVLPATNIQTGWFDHLYVQESYTDSTGSYVVFTKLPWEEDAVEVSINEIEILPCGFTILPDKSTDDGGSLLTVAFQTVIGPPEVHVPSLDQVHTIQNFISNVTSSIQQAMDPNNW